MEQNILEFVKQSLNAAPAGTAQKIADEKDIAYDTVLRIKRGDTQNPGIKTLEQIASYFRESESA
jgi:transcriptional regulator with XRE-family HTH domain